MRQEWKAIALILALHIALHVGEGFFPRFSLLVSEGDPQAAPQTFSQCAKPLPFLVDVGDQFVDMQLNVFLRHSFTGPAAVGKAGVAARGAWASDAAHEM